MLWGRRILSRSRLMRFRSFIHLCIHSPIQAVFIKCLLCARLLPGPTHVYVSLTPPWPGVSAW